MSCPFRILTGKAFFMFSTGTIAQTDPPLESFEPEAYHDPRGRFYCIRWQQPVW